MELDVSLQAKVAGTVETVAETVTDEIRGYIMDQWIKPDITGFGVPSLIRCFH